MVSNVTGKWVPKKEVNEQGDWRVIQKRKKQSTTEDQAQITHKNIFEVLSMFEIGGSSKEMQVVNEEMTRVQASLNSKDIIDFLSAKISKDDHKDAD